MGGKVTIFVVSALTAAIFLTIGILIGYYGIHDSAPSTKNIKPAFIDEVSTKELNDNLRKLTSVPHVAGTVWDKEQAEWIRDRFLAAGMDEAKTVSYEVLLSYPKDGVLNQISLIDDQGRVNFATEGKQPALGAPEESSSDVLVNFNAYSYPGVVEGNLVYAYYGRQEDYEYLFSRGINVSGHIVLVRYGAIFRGSKVQVAERYGASGVILFSDPQDKAQKGRNFTFPDSWWLPDMGVEMGTVYTGEGDPLTPGYPSIEGAFRIDEENHPKLPKIPVQPIGYDEAERFLRNISPENDPPTNWKGDLNASYSLGPLPLIPGWKVRMNISTIKQKRMIYNTIGILRGASEDDRYVLIGNHRDSWTFGALDPSSGTTSMIEVVRALGKIKKDKNWRPRRTMVFCSWGAEEYGLIGSFEWTEQFGKALSQRAVAYLNTDVAIGGNTTLSGRSSPTLNQLLIDSAKQIPNPSKDEISAGRKTVFDTWLANDPNLNNPTQPNVGNLGGGSDFKSFLTVLGVPGTDFGYTSPGSYPTYHSLYDNYFLSSEIIDRGFVHHQAVARLLGVVAVELADATILPFDIQAYALFLNQSFASIEKNYGLKLAQNNASIEYFRASVNYFSVASNTFVSKLSKVDLTDVLAVRKTNDRIMNLERFFIDPNGLPDRPETKHIVLSTSASNSYAMDSFAGLVDLLAHVGDQTMQQDPITWAKIQQHLSVISFMIGEAARSLNEDF